MQYQIFGGNLPAVSVRLDQGESIFTQSGGMSWMSEGIDMQTNMRGGLMGGLGRMFSGESLFMATYTAMQPQQEITLASTFPGDILPLTVRPGQDYICQKSAFLCAQPGVQLSVEFTRRISSGFFGGEGFILQRLAGQGMAFLELDGSVRELDLAPGQCIKVDTGNVAAFESTVGYEVQLIRGFKNILFGGEGLFLTVLRGPGKVWLQTMNLPSFASRILPYLPIEHK